MRSSPLAAIKENGHHLPPTWKTKRFEREVKCLSGDARVNGLAVLTR